MADQPGIYVSVCLRLWVRTCLVSICLLLNVHLHAAEALDPALIARLATTMAEDQSMDNPYDAEVWFRASDQRLSRFVKTPEERLSILQTVYTQAYRNQLDPDLILSVMHVESAFDHFAISKVGAQGLMQVMPFWRLEIGRPQDILTEIETNILYGTTILAHYLEVSKGDLVQALGRYNGSRGRLKYPEKVVSKYRKTWQNKNMHELPQLQKTCELYRLNACYL